jgi:hypothetical protein
VTSRFVAKMEDVLDVYQRPYDPRYPVVCADEKGKELQAQPVGRDPMPAQPNTPQHGNPLQDYTYEREGSANILVFSEPLRGWRQIEVNQDRTAKSFAHSVKALVDQVYPDAEKILLVVDNLNIHGPWSLFDAFSPEEANRIMHRIEWHFTPEHGSWLNMAEIELSALERQSLKQRFPDVATLAAQCKAWVDQRNQAQTKIHWQFTSKDARIRLRRLYPVIIT